MNLKTYSKFVAWNGLLFAGYAVVVLYINQYFIWLYLGLNLLIIYLIITKGILLIESYLLSVGVPTYIRKSIYFISGSSYFGSAIYGLLSFLKLFNYRDYSLLAMPMLISIILLAGSALGLFQIPNHK